MKDLNKLKKYIWVLPFTSGICWGAAGIFVRTLLDNGLDNLTIIFFRMLFASIILTIIIFFIDKSLLNINLRDSGLFAVSGFLGLTMMNALYNVAISEGSLALASVLLALSPVFVLISAAIILHEIPTVRKIICACFSLVGCILVSGFLESNGLTSTPKGILCGLLSAVSYACYGVILKKITKKHYHFLTITLYTSLFSAISLLPFSHLGNALNIMFDTSNHALLVIILHAVLSSVFPYALYSLSMQYLEAGKVAILVSTEPASATVIGLLYYGETPTIFSLLGLLCTICSIILLNQSENKQLHVQDTTDVS